VAHVSGTPDEIRSRVPAVLDAWEFMRDKVLTGGLVEPQLKQLCFRFLADDALWDELHDEFSDPELVELGCSIGFALGQQHFERTLGLGPHAGLP
jgi:hypothetical protein